DCTLRRIKLWCTETASAVETLLLNRALRVLTTSRTTVRLTTTGLFAPFVRDQLQLAAVSSDPSPRRMAPESAGTASKMASSNRCWRTASPRVELISVQIFNNVLKSATVRSVIADLSGAFLKFK